jgi:hypothetical protein
VDPDHVVVEHFNLYKKDGIDVLQTSTGGASFVTYDGLAVSRFNEPPFAGGLRCEGLGARCTVFIPCIVGTLRFVDCAAATIVVPLSYYGAVIAEGKGNNRSGMLGLLSRFSGGEYNLMLKDNQSIVISDLYSESSSNVLTFEGQSDDSPGRVTIQAAKINLLGNHSTGVLWVRNYAGQIFIGPSQFNGVATEGIDIEAQRPLDVFIFANVFYGSALTVVKRGSANIHQLGNVPVGVNQVVGSLLAAMFQDTVPAASLSAIPSALDDLRRLGEVYLGLNFQHILP